MPVGCTSANLIVSFGCAHIASARSTRHLALDDVERRHDLDVADVVAAEVDVHEARDELVGLRVLVVVSPCMNEFAQLPTPMIATRTLSCCRPRPDRSSHSSVASISCLRTCRTRWPTVIQAVQASSTSAQGRLPQGARTRPAVMTTTRSAREPIPTSPRRPRPPPWRGCRRRGTSLRRPPPRPPRTRGGRAGEDVGDRGEHEALADAVGGRVEERAERRRLAAGARERAVEDVEERPDDEDGRRDPVQEDLVAILEQDEQRGGPAQQDAARRQRVRRHAGAREADDRPRREAAGAGRVAVLDRGGSGHRADRSTGLRAGSVLVGRRSVTPRRAASRRRTRAL